MSDYSVRSLGAKIALGEMNQIIAKFSPVRSVDFVVHISRYTYQVHVSTSRK